MPVRYVPAIAAAIADHCQTRPLWNLSLGPFMAVMAARIDDDARFSTVDSREQLDVHEFLKIYLAALLTDNDVEPLVELGKQFIRILTLRKDTRSLIQFTNFVFKQFTLSPPAMSVALSKICVEANFKLHVTANTSIHELRQKTEGYYDFPQEIFALFDRYAQNLSLPKQLCFVFLTDNYFTNFCAWVSVFSASTGNSAHLLVIAIGPNLAKNVTQTLTENRLKNFTMLEFCPSRSLTPSGNGGNLFNLWYFNISVIRHLISFGHDVVYSDLDSFWLKDFFLDWNSPPLSIVDLLFMPTSDMPKYAVDQWGSTPCAGFFACRASDGMARFLSAWTNNVEIMFDDQIALAQMLLHTNATWKEGGHEGPNWKVTAFCPPAFDTAGEADFVKISLLEPSYAKRVGSPNPSTMHGATIWHPRWATMTHEHPKILRALVKLALDKAERPASRQEKAMSDFIETPREVNPVRPNLALGKPALQSSTSKWSRSQVPADDAAGANNGKISGEAGFHTAKEINPWWQVDLQDDFIIYKIDIYNRRKNAERLRNFRVLEISGWKILADNSLEIRS